MMSQNNNPPAVPSTPDPDLQTLVYTAIRAALTILGAIGISTPAWASNPSALWAVAGAVALLVSVGFSFYQKFQAARAAHAAAVASAASGKPLKPT